MQFKRGRIPRNPSVHVVRSAGEIWRFLVESGNIQPEHYDEDIVIQLCHSLNLADDCSSFTVGAADFSTALDRNHISREEFVTALFGAAQPFAEMMAQLCSFFERHSVRATDQALRMEFEFDEAGKELTFDLEHFREWLNEWEKVEGTMEADCWDTSSFWKLVQALSPRINRKAQIDDPGAREWIAANDYPGRETAANHWDLPPKPPEMGIGEIDRAVNRIYTGIVEVARACSPYGTYSALVSESDVVDQRSPRPAVLSGTSGNPAPIVEWDIRSLRFLESDYFLAALMRSLWEWLENLKRFDARNRLRAAQEVLSRLQTLFDSIPTKRIPGEIDLEKLLSFLKLPVWKERSALYSAWMISVIEKALHQYPVQIHDENGTLRFSFKATRMATFKSSGGEITLVAEHRAPLDQPIGESRKGHVQPDYVLFLGNTCDPENAKVVLELKQYLQPSVKKFSAALIDYTRAFQKAEVLLADYGPMSPAVMSSLPPDLAPRAAALGDVRPGKPREVVDLQQRIRQALPAPEPGIASYAPVGVANILIDVSGSMREVLTWQAVVRQLRDLASANPKATWVAVDTKVRATLTGPQALDKILGLEMSNSTELAQIVTQYDGYDTIVVTDSDGETQLRDRGFSLRQIGLAKSTGIDWDPATG